MDQVPMVWKGNNEGCGLVTTIKPKVDAGQATKRNWDLTLVVTIKADVLNQLALFGNVDQHFQNAVEEAFRYRGRVWPLKGQMVQIQFSNDEGIILDRCHAEVKYISVDFNTNRKVQVSKLVLHGMAVEDSNAIVGMMESRVRVKVLHAPDLRIVGDADSPEVGQLVTGLADGESVVGLCTEVTDNGCVIDDFGVMHTVQQISSAMFIESTDKSDVDEHTAEYKTAAEAIDERPSWAFIIEAIPIVHERDLVSRPSGSTGYINAAVMEQAIQQHAERTPEAGEG